MSKEQGRKGQMSHIAFSLKSHDGQSSEECPERETGDLTHCPSALSSSPFEMPQNLRGSPGN